MAYLAIRGGDPVRTKGFPGWPQVTDCDRELLKSLAQGQFKRGECVSLLEEEFAKYCGVKHVAAVANGTISLELILRALEIGYGDEVIISPYTFIATMSSVIYAGATPVFADIDRETYNMSPEEAEKRITPKTKAIIAPAIAGRPVDSDKFNEIAKKHGIYFIIDAAQAVGARWRGESVCKRCTAASISCQNSKNLTSGEGGFIVTDSDEVNEKIRTILAGGKKNGVYTTVGQRSAMTDLQASILRSQLTKLDAEVLLREKNASYLDGRLHDVPYADCLKHDERISANAYHLYITRFFEDVLAEKGLDFGTVLDAVAAEGIPMSRGYQPLYRFGCVKADHTEKIIGAKIDTTELPECAIASDKEGTWLYQATLLGTYDDMDDIADALLKIWNHADELR